MIVTNKNNHDDLIMALIKADQAQYSSGDSDITTTRVIDSPKVVALERDHRDEMTIDVEDIGPMFIGNAIHFYCEHLMKEVKGALPEQRYFREFMGWKLSGSADLMWRTNHTLYDYKTTIKSRINNPEQYKKWSAQQNINRWLHPEKENIHKLMILAIGRDFYSARGECWFKFISLPVWSDEEVEEYLTERIKLHQSAAVVLPHCEDRWTEPEKFAVMKPNRKSAVRVLASYTEALHYLETNNVPGGYIEHRPAVHKRCAKCSVAEWCEERNQS